MSTASSRILHLHIPKTAGTAIKMALRQARGKGGLKVYPHWNEELYKNIDPDEFDVFSGHYGFKTAQTLGGNIISIFRNPFDRFLSVYHFWRQLHKTEVDVSRKTIMATQNSIDAFLEIKDEMSIVAELLNRTAFQVAYGSSSAARWTLRMEGKTEDQILRMALDNLETFALIGTQDRLGDFEIGLERTFGLSVAIGQNNVTKVDRSTTGISLATRRRIYDWIYMDVEIYERARALSFRP